MELFGYKKIGRKAMLLFLKTIEKIDEINLSDVHVHVYFVFVARRVER